MSIKFSNTQRVSGNTVLANKISAALLKALGINSLNNNATVDELAAAIEEKLDAIGSGVTADTFLSVLSDVGNVQGSKESGEVALNTVYLTVGNMTTLTDAQIDSLACGDTVIKEDSSGTHSYRVTYKKDETGICITYTDASLIETVSYDYTDGHWIYNSTDITDLSSLMNK